MEIKTVNPVDDPDYIQPAQKIESAKDIQDNWALYLTDESRMDGGKADSIVFPHSEQQVSAILSDAWKKDIPVTISAARTGIVGGCIPMGGTLISLERLQKIIGFRIDKPRGLIYLRVQPGLSLEDLKERLDNQKLADLLTDETIAKNPDFMAFNQESDAWFYPVDPTEWTAHIGGTVATNASGGRSFRYGQTRSHVSRLRCCLAGGAILDMRRGQYPFSSKDPLFLAGAGERREIPFPAYQSPNIKNTAGYFARDPMDLMDLFIGSEGTLGVITDIEIVLTRKPSQIFGAVAFFPSEESAIRFVTLAREKENRNSPGIQPTTLEFFDRNALTLLVESKSLEKGPAIPDHTGAGIYFEQECTEETLDTILMAYDALLSECGVSLDNTWGAFDEKELHQMSEFRHQIPETVNRIIGQRKSKIPGLHKVSTDFVVPDTALDVIMPYYHETCRKAGLNYVIFGHIGENHVHLNILPEDEQSLEKAKAVYKEMARKVVSLGGTVSGEHGIGKLKKELLRYMYPEESLASMQQVKAALDPKGILGQGTLFELC